MRASSLTFALVLALLLTACVPLPPPRAAAPRPEVITVANAGNLVQLTPGGRGTMEAGGAIGGNSEIYNGGLQDLAFSPRGDVLATGFTDGSVKLYDAGSGGEVAKLEAQFAVFRVAFSSDGRVLAAVGGGSHATPGDGGVELWDVATRAPLLTLDDFQFFVFGVALSPDGALLATGSGSGYGYTGSLSVWNTATGERLVRLETEDATPYDLAFNTEGTLLAAVDARGNARLWHVADWTPAGMFTGTGGYALALAFSPDGTRLATAGSADVSGTNGDLRVSNVATTEQTAMPVKQRASVTHVAFGADGRLIASAGQEDVVRLWDAMTGEQLGTLNVPLAAAVAFSPDGRLLATGSSDGVVRLWGVAPERTD